MASSVAPFAGAWIEIYTQVSCEAEDPVSLPSRERGLKYLQKKNYLLNPAVAPFAGAWIEISSCVTRYVSTFGRSLRGSVD